jgi:ligand-binding SRPBCC domain-containing protein
MASTVIERKSVVDAPAADVWARIVTPEGINDEMRPVMTMSIPRGAAFSIDNVPIGTPIGRAWLRLFGVLPFDYDDLVTAEVQPGQSFREESTMLSMRQWRHERSITPDGATRAVVHDRLTFQLRAGLRLATPVVAASPVATTVPSVAGRAAAGSLSLPTAFCRLVTPASPVDLGSHTARPRTG